MKILNILLILSLLSPFAFCGLAVFAGGDVGATASDIYQSFVELATPSSKAAYIGVITAGSTWGTAKSIAQGIVYRLKNIYGAANVEWLPFHTSNGNICTSSSLNDKLRSMTGLYFNGGETDMILDCLYPNGRVTSALSVIQSRYNSEDLAVFASSAGVLAMSSRSVIEDRESWGSIHYGSLVDGNGGFNLFSFGFLDVHFTERGRQGRLIRTVVDRTSESTKGFGIDESTAMVIEGSRFTVAGTKGVYIIHANEMTKFSGKRFKVENVKVSRLTKGDMYNFGSGTITWASYKSTLTSSRQNNVSATMSSNIFSAGTFATIANGLFKSRLSSSTYGLTSETYPKYRVDMRKTSSSSGAIGVKDGIEQISYKNMYVDIECYQNC